MNAYQVEWKDITLPFAKLEDPEGQRESLNGKEAVGTGLGYCTFPPADDEPDGMPLYSIVHAASGRRLHNQPILIEELAKRMIGAFAPITDWTQSLDEITANPDYLKVVKKLQDLYHQIDKKFWKQLIAEREETYWGE